MFNSVCVACNTIKVSVYIKCYLIVNPLCGFLRFHKHFSVLMKPWEADFTLYFETCFVYIHYFTLSEQCCVSWLLPPPVAQWNGVDPLAGRRTVSLECTCVCMSVRSKQNRGPLIKTLLYNVVKNSAGCLKARQMVSNFTSKQSSFFLPQYHFVYSHSRNTNKCFFYLFLWTNKTSRSKVRRTFHCFVNDTCPQIEIQ